MARTARGERRGDNRGAPHVRLRVGFVVIAMVLSVFAARLVQLQGIDPRQYAARAAAEGAVSVVLPAERGQILDRNGQPLADSIAGLMVVADPSVTQQYAPELASFLSKRLDIDYFETLEHLSKTDSRFQYVARQVPAARAAAAVRAAEERGFKGLFTRDDPVRVYPAHDIAANLVGFLGTPHDDGAAQPLAGIENAFDQFLAGRDGEARYQTSLGSKIPLGDATVTPAQDGNTITTTIDRDLQLITQRVLRRTVANADAESGVAIIMDTRSGEILSLADYPSYDAANPYAYPESSYTSRALSDVYEPGSVEKVLTAAGLIDSGYVTNRTKFRVPGILLRQDRPIHDYWDHDTIKLTLAGIIAKSSNIGTVMAADLFKSGELRSYLSKFGLGTRTDVGVEGETNGILPAGADWTDQVDDRIAFGQSLSVNAVQMAAAVNAIANGGVRVDPSIIRGVATTDTGQEVGSGVATSHRVVSEDAAWQTAQMMERVTDPEAGVGPLAAVPGYRVAGKTGTAQRAVDGVYDGSYTVSFAGFAPVDDPRFTIYVVVQNPRNGGGGGSVAAPAFSELMKEALRRYGVPPTGTRPSSIPVEW